MYVWSKKAKHKAHIINKETGKTFCKLENSSAEGKFLVLFGEKTDRKICTLCSRLIEKPTKWPLNNNPQQVYIFNDSFYSTRQWHTLRYKAYLKYGTRCMICGADKTEGIRIHVDHIKPISKYPELALDIDNLQILCALCNSGKGSWDYTDWRNKH